MVKLSIVIPCYNEADSLPNLVAEINTAMDRNDVEVILVNDGSRDDSARVLEQLTRNSPYIRTITNATNQGYGGAILAGLMAGKGTYLGWMHGDLQTPFKDALLALRKIESLHDPEDIYVKGLRKGRSLFDRFFTLGMSVFETFLLRRRLFDINAQPNIFHRRFFASWQEPPRDFSLDLYALFIARSRGMKIIRIPVIFPPRQYGHSTWNLGFTSRLKFIRRTVRYSLELRTKVHKDHAFSGLASDVRDTNR